MPSDTTDENYCNPLFYSELHFKCYVLNQLQSDGTEIFITHLRNPNQNFIQNELKALENDIIVTENVLKQLGIS